MPGASGSTNMTGNYIDKGIANDTYALDNKASALYNLRNYTGTIEYYDKALAIEPKDTTALTGKGLALDNLRNHTGAIEYYDKALAINPKDTTASAGLSRAEEDAYSRGYSDAVADAHYKHGHGYDSSCPSVHSEAYCQNYQSGYATGWRSVTTTQTQGGKQGQQMSETVKGPNGITGRVTAPPGSTIGPVTVTVLTYTHLNGTWNFVNSHGNVSGTITFGTEDLCKQCKWNWQL